MTLSKDYVDYLRVEIEKSFHKQKARFSYDKIAELTALSRATVGRVFKDLTATRDTHDCIVKTFGLLSHTAWKARHSLTGQVAAFLSENYWLSYRFNKERQLYISSWIFKVSGTELRVEKHAPNGTNFEGVFAIDDRMGISGTLTNSTLEIKYHSYLPAEGYGQSGIGFDSIVFNVLFKHGEDIYATVEVLYRQPSDGNQPAHKDHLVKEKGKATIRFIPDNNFYPSNQEYLAYNFLTRNGPRIRIPVSYPNAEAIRLLRYEHTIRIGFPVHSIKSQEEFDRVHPVAQEINQLMQQDYGFRKEKIYFELLNFSSLDALSKPAPYLFEKNKTINYTHFLAVIPKLEQQSMGIFAEIFYRVGRGYPVVILYEDERSLLYVLRNIILYQHVVNLFHFQCRLEDVPDLLRRDKEMLLSFRLR